MYLKYMLFYDEISAPMNNAIKALKKKDGEGRQPADWRQESINR